jgi:hypothetical protein
MLNVIYLYRWTKKEHIKLELGKNSYQMNLFLCFSFNCGIIVFTDYIDFESM